MAKLLPELTEGTLNAHRSRAEADVYRAFREHLGTDIVVLFDLPVIFKGGRLYESEADFLILDPTRGLLVVEVKGGGIRHDPAFGRWTSKDREGVEHDIKDPFLQAQGSKHTLLQLLRGHARWSRMFTGHVLAGHAVFFPDLTRAQLRNLRLSNTAQEIVGGVEDLRAPAPWVEGAFRFCQGPTDLALGRAGVELAVELLRKEVFIQPLRGARMRDQELERIRLTQQQALVLEIIADRQRVAVAGGAGTGKTVLALEEARRRANEGRRPLLICFNRLLAEHLKDQTQATGVHAVSLHQLYEWWISVFKERTGRNLVTEAEGQFPGQSRELVILPQAFCVALDEGEPLPFDTVVLDEGQDLCDADWIAIDALIDKLSARLLVFFDHNQVFYKRSSYFPFTDPRDILPLTRNCRNTDPIHGATYRYYNGPTTHPPAIPGDAPIVVVAATREAQAQKIREIVRGLLAEGVASEDVAVLILARDDRVGSYVSALPTLGAGTRAVWAQGRAPGGVSTTSVERFKGLEAAFVLLWVGGDVDAAVHRQWLYVGMSRARSCLYVVGTASACREALEGR